MHAPEADNRFEVQVGAHAHDALTIHAVRQAPVPGDGCPEVLQFECTLEAGSKEAPERCDERGKHLQDHGDVLITEPAIGRWA